MRYHNRIYKFLLKSSQCVVILNAGCDLDTLIELNKLR